MPPWLRRHSHALRYHLAIYYATSFNIGHIQALRIDIKLATFTLLLRHLAATCRCRHAAM